MSNCPQNPKQNADSKLTHQPVYQETILDADTVSRIVVVQEGLHRGHGPVNPPQGSKEEGDQNNHLKMAWQDYVISKAEKQTTTLSQSRETDIQLTVLPAETLGLARKPAIFLEDLEDQLQTPQNNNSQIKVPLPLPPTHVSNWFRGCVICVVIFLMALVVSGLVLDKRSQSPEMDRRMFERGYHPMLLVHGIEVGSSPTAFALILMCIVIMTKYVALVSFVHVSYKPLQYAFTSDLSFDSFSFMLCH
jgi:hypothetical protein